MLGLSVTWKLLNMSSNDNGWQCSKGPGYAQNVEDACGRKDGPGWYGSWPLQSPLCLLYTWSLHLA